MIPHHAWTATQKEAAPHKKEVHIWRIFAPKYRSIIPQLQSVLNEEERARAEKFHFDQERELYKVAHSALRLILCDYAQLPPKELAFTLNDYGKPELAESPLQFNLSHSGDLVLIAFAAETSLGIDVEKIDEKRAKMDLARRFFSSGEIVQLGQLQNGNFIEGFFNTWTRKEAYIKARGAGLSVPLDSFTVSLMPGEPAELIEDKVHCKAPEEWTLRHITAHDGYAAALAVEGKDVELKLFDWLAPF